jgi:copper chaperone CopZ
MTTQLTIKGLHCSACKKLTEKRITSLPGVTSVEIDVATGLTRITSTDKLELSQVSGALSGTPYSIS